MMDELRWFAREVRLSDIVVDPSLQIRVELNEERITDFVDIIDQLPPMKLVKVGKDSVLSDGFHRYYAFDRSRRDVVKVMEAVGTYKDALLVAVQNNSKGALPLSRADKRKTIGQMLTYYPERANSWIAEEVGSSMQTVDGIRKDMEASGIIPELEEFQKRDGKTTPRKHATPVKEETEEDKQEELDLARLSYSKPSEFSADEKEVDEIRDLMRATSTRVMDKPIQQEIGKLVPIVYKKNCSFDIALTNSVDLPIGMYRLYFIKENGRLEVRLFSVSKSGDMPTDVGIIGNSDMANVIVDTIGVV